VEQDAEERRLPDVGPPLLEDLAAGRLRRFGHRRILRRRPRWLAAKTIAPGRRGGGMMAAAIVKCRRAIAKLRRAIA
jgi:hypothetical protein